MILVYKRNMNQIYNKIKEKNKLRNREIKKFKKKN